MNEEIRETEEYEVSGEVLETVELTIVPPAAGTLITCKDPDGLDQTPVPEIVSKSGKYFIETIRENDIERPEAFWKTYNTLEYYSDVVMEAGNTYTVFARVKAAPGYVFNDPVELTVNGMEVPSEEVEDYTLEGDSFTFYFDVEVREADEDHSEE